MKTNRHEVQTVYNLIFCDLSDYDERDEASIESSISIPDNQEFMESIMYNGFQR